MPPLRLTSMNHISRVCENVHRTKEFYETVLGFVEVRRPTQLEEDFEGSWWVACPGINTLPALND